MVAIIDYGVGNLFSLLSSLKSIGADAIVTNSREEIRAAQRVILPGVGAFADAARKLRETGMAEAVLEECAAGKPLLGICLGMQLLFEESLEYGVHRGLGLIPGTVRPIAEKIPPELKIPHIGWNALEISRPGGVLKYTKPGEHVYFVHSYWADTPDEFITSRTEYGAMLTASVQRGNVMGTQFHPEKSGRVGLDMLRAFCETEAGA
ncbi:MAG: imidazole glycerol phosphate synthase subunit HisH [Candidatus Heteroscillospira sp.]|jgi:glutamine amidotransferase